MTDSDPKQTNGVATAALLWQFGVQEFDFACPFRSKAEADQYDVALGGVDMSADAVVIRFSAWKIFRMLLLCCGSSAAGYWIVHASFNSLVDTRPPLLVVIAGYIVLVSSLLALLLSLVPLMKAGPALVLEERGFDDHSAAASLGFVEWADIAGVRLWSSGSQSALCLRLKNPDKYAQGIGPIKRAMLKLNHKTAPGEIALSAILLAVRFERLEALVMSHLSVARGAEQQQHSENLYDET